MIRYRSIADLSDLVRSRLNLIPASVDLVVGIPRSGMLLATMIAMNKNLKVCSLDELLENTEIHTGITRQSVSSHILLPQDAHHVLIVDDSLDSGKSLDDAKRRVAQIRANNVTYAVGYCRPESVSLVDIVLEVLPMPRVFEWNVMHRPFLEKCLLDIDGVLCADPDEDENDDGNAYANFLVTTRCNIRPSYPVKGFVTSRLERYRPQTESWLKDNRIAYGTLSMLDLPNAETRRQLGSHASFKAEIYGNDAEARLFIESDPRQAAEIARRSGKPVLCFEDQVLYRPGVSFSSIKSSTRLGLLRLPSLLRRAKRLGLRSTLRVVVMKAQFKMMRGA